MDAFSVFALALYLSLVALVAGGLLWGFRDSLIRDMGMEQMAAEMKLTWKREMRWSTFREKYPPFYLLTLGHGGSVRNIMRGWVDGVPLLIFDYQYVIVTQGGRRNATYFQTVILFPLPTRELPCFTLRPATDFHRLASKVGYQKIRFQQYELFSQRHLLRGRKEADIRELFTSYVLQYLEQEENKKLCIECEGRTLLFYIPDKLVPPSQLPAFIERGVEVLNLFTKERPVMTGHRSGD